MGPKRGRDSSEIQSMSGDPEAIRQTKRNKDEGSSKTQSLSGNPKAILCESEAREKVFNSILDELNNFGLFSNPSLEPSIFIVYAHDNESEGKAHDGCVRTMISWLRQIHVQILSDQFPVHDFDHRSDQRAISNIVANQLCLLPTDSASEPTRKCVGKVIVCGSDVLENYYNKPWVLPYISDIVEIVNSEATQSKNPLRSELERCVHTQAERLKHDFHHVVTELAFLQVRKSHFDGEQKPHGMIPVSLKQGEHKDKAPMQYLPFFSNTDLKLTLKSTEKSSMHKLFLKLLVQLFPHHIDFIELFKKLYDSILKHLELNSKAFESEEQLDKTISQHITKAHKEYRNRSSVRMRDSKIQEYAGKLGEKVSQVLKMIELKTQWEILNWLSPIKAHNLHGTYCDVETNRTKGTCEWVIEDEKFCRWRDHKGSALIFLRGNMGTGKTYSTSRVIDWAKETLSEAGRSEALAYFYCYKQDPQRSEAKHIVQNIIRQLATGPWKASESSNTIHEIVYDLWQKKESHGSSNFNQWADCLLGLVDTYPRTTIVLDALDECKESQRPHLINLLVKLVTRDSKAQIKIFVSTRPDEVTFQNLDGKHHVIDMQEKDTKEDIATFVRARIPQHRRWSKWDQGFKKELTDTLLEKSRDIFLLASLHIDLVLGHLLQRDIRVVLGKLPEKLTEAYEIYGRATNGEIAKDFINRALRWVLCSARPLTTDELLFAVSQDPEEDSISPSDPEVSEDMILTSFSNLLSLDAVSNDESADINYRGNGPPVWRLAHQAVADFLETNDCYAAYAHYEAAKLCLKLLLDASFGASAWILSHPDHNSECGEDFSDTSETFEYSEEVSGISEDSLSPCTENRGPRVVRSYRGFEVAHQELQNPLAEYAIYAWPTHVRAHEHSVAPIARRIPGTLLHRLSQMIQRFLGKPNAGSRDFKRWYEHKVCRDLDDPQWCVFASRSVPPCFFSEYGETEMTPIIFACHLGFYTTLKEWWDSPDLDHNAAFRSYYWSRNILRIDGSKPTVSLSLVAVACANDEVEILKCLLDRGAKVNTETEDDVPAIMVAAVKNSNEVARELIQHGTKLCSPFTERYETVLWFAMVHGSWDTMELLLEPSHREQLEEQLEIERTLRHFPYYYLKSGRAISMLLDFGIDVNWSLSGATLLATAAHYRWEDLVARLLDKGAEVNTECQNDSFPSALDAATAEPMHTSIARRLVAKGARISGRSIAQMLRLVRSDRNWNDALQLLQGDEVNHTWMKMTSHGGHIYLTSPLIEEVRTGNPDGVRHLIEFGADVNLCVAGYYEDALDTAFVSTLDRGFSSRTSSFKLGYPVITGPYPTGPLIEALVEAGANLESLDGERLNTALAAAALAGLEHMVDDFLARGASPSAFCTHKFTTALGAAAASTQAGAPNLVDKLLDKGAVVNAYFPEKRDLYEQSRCALDFPLQLMLEEGRQSKEPEDAENDERNQRLDTWLKSASTLVSRGAIWDIGFSEWKKCFEKVNPDFSQREAERLDEIQLGLESNNSFFELHESAYDRWRRVSCIMRKICRK